MALQPGDKFGPYLLIAPIGKGGMGEVWKARDTRLDRIVAMKFSEEQFSERFEREAKAISSLNHPNICTLYDVGPNYLVMEYIEGAPLKGPLPLDQALKYAAQICDALDAAHKKGITHRDLKPANILVTKAGIKLLDFGLAKLASANSGQTLKPDDATLTMALTGKNEIVGTLYYMSPEQLQAQANGQEIDARSDVFSFGIVLYEMLTGKRAFEGASPASVIAAIMERPAPSIADVAPPALDRVLKKCLAKDPDDRWQTARDLKSELDWIASASGEVTTVPTPVARHRRLPWIAAAVLAFALIVSGVGWYRATRPAELKPLVRLDVDLGAGVSLGSTQGGGTDTIISPDGTRLVYVSQGKLFTRRMDQPKTTELAGTEGASAPFFSPDGHWLAFFAAGKLKKISVEGGAAVTLCNAPSFLGGGWGEDGNIIAALSTSGGLSRIPSVGGAPSPATELAPGEITHRWPQILPGGKAVLFTSHTRYSGGYDQANIEVVSLADHRVKTLQRGGTFGRYMPASNEAGHLVYINQGTLFAVPFDPEKLEVRGTPSPMLEEIAYSDGNGSAQFDFSQNGTLVYRSGGAGAGLLTVAWLDSVGKTQPLLDKPGAYGRPALSPDGQRLALEVAEGSGGDIWVYEWQRDTMTRLTFDGIDDSPVWSPDGRYIVFRATGAGMSAVRSDGAAKPQPLTQSKNAQYPFSFTPDGKRMAFNERHSGFLSDLWTVPINGDGAGLRNGKPEIFRQTAADERWPAFSPDGRWLAYASNESGTFQIYVRAFPDKGGKWQISNNGGVYPKWSRNGLELFFRTEDSPMIMVASYKTKGDSFVAEKPRVWSERKIANTGPTGNNYDLAPDGKRFAVLMPVEAPEAQQAQNHVVFLLNFFDELRRKVPAGK
jgi:Tol biopolymer transport system component/tRNA A-37 threonylcarbamoyl transferase component Bud32